nr:MAG TPA: hypothetical protein [Caudoviricetes sp.]
MEINKKNDLGNRRSLRLQGQTGPVRKTRGFIL